MSDDKIIIIIDILLMVFKLFKASCDLSSLTFSIPVDANVLFCFFRKQLVLHRLIDRQVLLKIVFSVHPVNQDDAVNRYADAFKIFF
jgi:hypothetical protein